MNLRYKFVADVTIESGEEGWCVVHTCVCSYQSGEDQPCVFFKYWRSSEFFNVGDVFNFLGANDIPQQYVNRVLHEN